MAINSEGIHATRPWTIYGEGPSTKTEIKSGGFNEDKRGDFTADDVRFTTKGSTLYAFVMGWPEKEAAIHALGLNSQQEPGRILRVQLLGYGGTLDWKQEADALKVKMPAEKPSAIAVAFKRKIVPQGLNRLRKNMVVEDRRLAGPKGHIDLITFAARLKSCPVTKPLVERHSASFSAACKAHDLWASLRHD